MHRAEDLRLVADVAVGQEDDVAKALGVVGEVERGLDALDHHGSAAAAEAVDVVEAALDVPPRRFDGFAAQLGGVGAEADDLEGVAGLHGAEGAAHRVLGLLHRLAAHRARAVEHEDELDGLALEVAGLGRRDEHQAEHAGAVAVVVRDHAAADAARGDLVAEHEVLVGHGVGVSEADGGPGGVGPVHVDDVGA